MRDYARFSPKFWVGKTGKQLRAMGCEHQVIAAYLITSPQANMIGLYYLPTAYVAHETGVPEARCKEVLRDLIGIEFCSYDEASEVVWVHEATRFQLGDTGLKDRQRIGAVKQYEAAPQCSLLDAFFERYQEFLPFTARRKCSENTSPSEALNKPFVSPTDTSDEKREIKQRAKRSATSDEQGASQRVVTNGVSLEEFEQQVSNGVAAQLRNSEKVRFSKLVSVVREEVDYAMGRARSAKANSASYVLGVIESERKRAADSANGPAPPPFIPHRQVSKQEAAMLNAMEVTEAYNARVREQQQQTDRSGSSVVCREAGGVVRALPKHVDAVVDGGSLVATPARPAG